MRIRNRISDGNRQLWNVWTTGKSAIIKSLNHPRGGGLNGSITKGVALLCLFSTIVAHSATIHVKSDAVGTMDGSSWGNAYNDLQKAINAAQSGDEVWVAAGTYKPSSWPNGGFNDERAKHFSLKDGVALYGGFAGTETTLAERNITSNITICSGDIGAADDDSDNCYHVFFQPEGSSLSNTAVLDGFTITKGNANGDSAKSSHSFWGGGMHDYSGSPTISNCIFKENTAGRGGGVFKEGGSPIISNCSFTSNVVTSTGGGGGGGFCYGNGGNPKLENCVFNENTACDGGGIWSYSGSLTITDCSFTGNTASAKGGAIKNYYGSTITNCVITGNKGLDGGGIYIWYGGDLKLSNSTIANNVAELNGGGINFLSVHTGGSLNISGCLISDNSAAGAESNNGGGIYMGNLTAVITNTTISGNASKIGGGIYNNGAVLSLLNCTLTANQAETAGGMYNGSASKIKNSIFWNNTASVSGDEIVNSDTGETSTVSYCVIKGGYSSGTDIIADDPLLGDLADNGGSNKTYSIPLTSPANVIPQTAGDDDWNECPSKDQRGYYRNQNFGVRAIGAFDPNADEVVWTVTFSATSGGSITGTSTQVIGSGENCMSVTATPSANYEFAKWTKDGADYSTGNPLSVTNVTENMTITANFELKTFKVTFTAIGEGTLSGETTQTVSYGSSTTAVTAVPNTGYKFSKWTIGDVSYSTSNPLTISKITEALDLTANFEKMTYSISGTVSGDVKEVSLELSGVSTATATSEANGNYSFSGLSDGSYTVTPSKDTYTFSPASYDVTISGANATGKDFVSTATYKLTMAVSPESSGSTEPTVGTSTVSKGSSQTLKATASSGYVFSEWKAEPSGNATIANSYSSETSATISGDVTITATFNTESESATLTTAVSPENSGSVTPNSSVEVKINEAVAITATASTGYYFQGWTYTENATVADASSASTTATLTGDATVTALFSAVPVETAILTMKSDSPSGGSTSPETGSASTVNKGAAISVTATPGEGYSFAGWSADSSGNAIIGDASSTSTSVTLSGDATVTASFSVLPVGEATLTLKVDPENAGTLSPEAGSKEVMTGVSQKIEATAASGYYFIGWLGDSNAQIADSASSSTTVVLSGDSSVTALFSATATGELSVEEIKISLKSSKEGKDSAKLIATLPSETSFDNTSQDLKVMIGDWSVTIAKGSDWKEKKDKISYKEQADDGKVRVDYDSSTGILLVDVKKTTVAGKVNPAEGVDVYVVIGDSHYWDNIDVDEKTHWKGLAFEQTDGFALEAKKFLAAWDSKDGGLKEKYSLRVIGSGLADPFTDGYSDSVVPTISVDQSEWEIEAEPRGGNGKYVYKLRDGSISQYLKLDFEKGKWSFTATDKEPISPLDMSRGGDLTLTVKFTDGTETKYSVIKISPDIRSKITYKAGK